MFRIEILILVVRRFNRGMAVFDSGRWPGAKSPLPPLERGKGRFLPGWPQIMSPADSLFSPQRLAEGPVLTPMESGRKMSQ